MTIGTRGKVAEGKVRDLLKALEGENLRFTFNRIADARSAGGGRGQAVPGDFQAFYMDSRNTRFNFLIEIKETEHEFRLPHKNFGEDAVARMRLRQLAGSECLVLIYHSTLKKWRNVEFDFFLHREGGSWDLRPFPLVDLKPSLIEALHILY